jgi:hypothetical protein
MGLSTGATNSTLEVKYDNESVKIKGNPFHTAGAMNNKNIVANKKSFGTLK